MGTRTRDQRRMKQQKRQRADRARRVPQPPAGDDALARGLVLAAVQSYRKEPRAEHGQHLMNLVNFGNQGLDDAVERAVDWWVERALDAAWSSGWQPADVTRAVRRVVGADGAAAVTSAVALSSEQRPEMRTDDRWSAQVNAYTKHLGFSTVFGTRTRPRDGRDPVHLAARAGDRSHAGRPRHRPAGRSRTRSFRQSFLVAYAQRIGEHLTEATANVVAEREAEHGDRLLPVLARRDEEVDAAVRATYPELSQGGAAINNYSGWVAGRAAAEVASLTVGEELVAGGV